MPKAKPIVWSHSSLKAFESCPRKFHELKILKNYPSEETEEIRYGTRFHEAMEMAIDTGSTLPEEFSFAQEVLDALARLDGERHSELDLGVDKWLAPCRFMDRECWARGIADLLVVNRGDRKAWVLDWKTGKDKYPDKDQLVLMSLLTLAKFDVDIVKSALIFVVKKSLVPFTMSRDEAPRYWQQYRERVAVMEKAYAADSWHPIQGPFCRKWCPVSTCEYHGGG
jgi:hypothetical protein